MRTKILFLFVIITATYLFPLKNVNAQRSKAFIEINLPHYDKKPYHFGMSLGINKMDFALKPISSFHDLQMIGQPTSIVPKFDTLHSVHVKAENGFNIGIISNLRISDFWDLRFIPTLTFGDRTLIYNGKAENGNELSRTQKIESTFIDFPLHLKYKSVRMINTRVYVIGGLKYSHDLASSEDKEDIEEEIYARIRKNDVYYELGVGFDYYFYYFKFSTEIKASFGLANLIKRENTMFTNSIDRLNSQILMISFHFE